MSGIIEWLNRVLGTGCPHEWEKVAVLNDRPKNPAASTVIHACRLCAKTKEKTFRAPAEEPRECPPHRWETFERTTVASKERGNIAAIVYSQRCKTCGELSAVRVDSLGAANNRQEKKHA